MDTGITVALITLAGVVLAALIAQWGIARKSRNDAEKRGAVFEATISAKLDLLQAHTSGKIDGLAETTGIKIDTLTKKVEKHNHIVERMYGLEQAFEDEKEVCQRRFDIIEQALPRSPRKEKIKEI